MDLLLLLLPFFLLPLLLPLPFCGDCCRRRCCGVLYSYTTMAAGELLPL